MENRLAKTQEKTCSLDLTKILTPRTRLALEKSTISGQAYTGCLVSVSVLYSCSEIICGGGEEWVGLELEQTITRSFLQMFFLLYLISISHNPMRQELLF